MPFFETMRFQGALLGHGQAADQLAPKLNDADRRVLGRVAPNAPGWMRPVLSRLAVGCAVDTVARWDARDLADLFNAVGTTRGLAYAIVEKDVWVCWTLKRLFVGEVWPGLVFKGGTLLSKSYSIVKRFSEEINLSVDRAALGYTGDKDPEKAESTKKATKLIDQLVTDVQAHVTGPFLAALREAIARELDLRISYQTQFRAAAGAVRPERQELRPKGPS